MNTNTDVALHIYYKNKSGKFHLMKSEVGKNVTEDDIKFVNFGCQLLMEKQKITVQSFLGGNLMFHINARMDGLNTILITNKDYPKDKAHSMIIEIAREFTDKYNPSTWKNVTEGSIYGDNFLDQLTSRSSVFFPVSAFENTNETLFDIYLSNLKFEFPTMTKETKMKAKLISLRRQKLSAVKPEVNCINSKSLRFS